MLIFKYLNTLGRYLILMGRSFARPERMRMFLKQYVKEMSALGVDSIGIVLLISFFIGAVICIQMKLNIQSPWMPRWVSGYTTREILLLEFSSSIMCLILAGKVGSNIASELGTMRVTQQIDALDNNLVELLSNRMNICRKIGSYKKEHNMTVLQANRYKEIIDKRGAQGELFGMDSEFVKHIFELVHEESVRQQMEVINKQ